MYLLKYFYLYTKNYLIDHISLFGLAAKLLEAHSSSHVNSIQTMVRIFLMFALGFYFTHLLFLQPPHPFPYVLEWISESRLKFFVHCDGVLIIVEGRNRRGLS